MKILFYMTATALLWVPALWLFPKKHRLVRLSHVLDNDMPWWRLFERSLVINLVRAWLGMTVCFSDPKMDASEFAWMSMIPAIGVLMQLWRGWTPTNQVRPAPVAYLTGITLAMMPLACALGAVTLAITLAMSFRRIRVFFLVGAIAVPVIGHLFGAPVLESLLTGALYFLPLLVTASRSRPPGLCLPMKYIQHSRLTSPTRDVPIMDSRPPFPISLNRNPNRQHRWH
ncbi:hypothetical protein Ga0100231_010015 [Opitutaceae bacterium TAV4]|uniref:hypothetical protein n=1 Tax=Geminisphaera colitermitum TaxID=1148786 RepID=UPI0001965022|nr:hypothetical protein [Geminisphaera colitermitum]RRJ94626.1 hypothetical protein Ga0100231_010015 [Opitutaceae bacterium TAV4]RRJ98695.1 hypothetical protein Ga0100230_010135 [Opitutaceae bacterium TAV3]